MTNAASYNEPLAQTADSSSEDTVVIDTSRYTIVDPDCSHPDFWLDD